MANRQRQTVRYRKFQPDPVKAEGLLPVARENGDLERRVAAGFVRLANQFGSIADRQAAIEGARAGERDALAGRPTAGTVAGGTSPAPSSGSASAPRGIVVGSKDANQTAASARDYLINKHGLAPHHAAAIAGHGMQESNFNLKAVGDNGTAHGAFQWRGDRLANLKRFAARSGRSWQQLDAQLDFVVHELGTTESYAGKALRNSGNLQDAVAAFMHFERPAGYSRANPAGGHGFKNRLAFAQGLSGVVADEAVRSGPISVTPIDDPDPDPAVFVPGQAGTFRPTGSSTIRGRAYDVAGTRTYLQQLDVTMHQDMANVYDTYADDPVMLEKAMGELKQAHLQESVFDEIAGDYSAAFEKRAFRMVQRSREAFKVKAEQREREAFLGRIDQLEEEKAKFLAGQNAGAERDAEDLFSIQSSIDSHYDDAVRRGLMTPTEARQFKENSLRDTSTAYYLGQADGKSSEEIASMRKDMAKDYSAGEMPHVDRESYSRIEMGLAKLEKDRAAAEKKGFDDLRRKGNDLAERVLAGETIPAHEVAAYHRLMQSTPGAEGIAQSSLRRLKIAQLLKTNSVSNVRQNLEDLLKGEDGTIDTDDLAFARGLIAKQEQSLKSDPLALAERYGAVPPVAGIMDGLQTVGATAAIAERIDAARTVSERFGVPPKYFTGTETAEVAELIRTDPDAGLELVSGIVEAGGEQAGEILQELRSSAPEAEWAGIVLALGGSNRAAQDALLGNQPGPDGKSLPNPIKKKRAQISGSTIGSALSQLHPDDRNRVENSGLSIARKRAQEAGVKVDSEDAQEIYQRALNEAAGAVYGPDGQRGGFAEVNGYSTLLPPGMTVDDVEDALEELSDEDLEAMGRPFSPLEDLGVSVSADDIRDGVLLAVAPGIYRVARERNGQLHFIGDGNGGLWELDMNRLIGVQRVRAGVPYYKTRGEF